LCEPVFAVLTSSLGWFSGKRINIEFWIARKRIADEQGLLIYSIDSCPPEIASSSPLFDEVYDGKLPEKATDKILPSWIVKELIKNSDNNSNLQKDVPYDYSLKICSTALQPYLREK